jgi:phosphoglycolate phosphatase/pyrophosphatase PpaX
MLGMHFVDMFNDLGIDVPDFDEFIKIYKSYYFEFIIESFLYPNIEETLSFISERDIKISLLTTKGQDQAEKIINHFNLSTHFDFIMGRREGIAHKPSAEPLLIICEKLNVEILNTMMVGDTEIDICCGKNAGAVTCAVSYGFRSEEKLLKYDPDYIFNSILELRALLSNNKS